MSRPLRTRSNLERVRIVWFRTSVLLSMLGLACGCPKGNVVSAMRDASFTLQLQTADGVVTGNGTSPPSGEGISFDRSAVVASPSQTSPPLPDDLVLFVMSPGCHPDSSGKDVCDSQIRTRLTIHGVKTGATSFELDDQRAQLELAVALFPPPGATGPCPGKPQLTGCPVDAGPAPPDVYVSYTGLHGQITLTQLAEDCTDVLSICALSAKGTFSLSATGPHGEMLKLMSGSLTATDGLTYKDTCNNT